MKMVITVKDVLRSLVWRGNSKTLALLGLAMYAAYIAFANLNPEYFWQDGQPLILDPTKRELKKIVLWNSWFYDLQWEVVLGRDKERVVDCGGQFQTRCVVSTDRRNELRYDAVLFHGKNSPIVLQRRHTEQVYIMLLQESPLHFWNRYVPGGEFYNWTITYHRTADIRLPYLQTQPKLIKPNDDPSILVNLSSSLKQLSTKRAEGAAMVLWIVSHCHTVSWREQYVHLLEQHMQVDIYGRCGKDCPTDCFEHLAKSGQYKFYLSFENAACEDYITEKAFRPLQVGMVPVVYGGLTGEEYQKTLPPDSYIDVRSFPTPKHLANYLRYLDHNNTAYLQFFTWRTRYEVKPMGISGALCLVCHKLQNTSAISRHTVDFGQLWNPDDQCDINFFEKVTGGPRKPSYFQVL